MLSDSSSALNVMNGKGLEQLGCVFLSCKPVLHKLLHGPHVQCLHRTVGKGFVFVSLTLFFLLILSCILQLCV